MVEDATLSYDAMHQYLVREVMTEDVVVARPDDSLLAAARMMRDRKVSGLPVLDADGALVGVLSERDIVREIQRAGGIATLRGMLDLLVAPEESRESLIRSVLHHLEKLHVEEAMTHRVVSTGPDAPLVEAAHLFRQFGVNHLPVVEGGRVVGIVARGDMMRTLQRPGSPSASGRTPPSTKSKSRAAKPRPTPHRRRMDDVR